MQIIPVIDLKDGLVVHAVRGDRSHYQAIHHHSVLTESSEIDSVLKGFLSLYPFRRFYIADLNAIIGSGDHYPIIQSISRSHPDVEFWLDNGSQLSAIEPNIANLKTVIGTESQHSPPCHSKHEFILSLDFKNGRPAGLSDWFNKWQYWPERVIVMTLNRVGSQNGPDLDILSALRQSHREKFFFAAGGIRNIEDLAQLKEAGIFGALIATCLHSGAISAHDLQNL
ncbi:MAG: HisA/HisF-related TIM barrel protein [Gammaproteobacteria bacterium]